jgi:starch phosphorylase
LENEIIPLYYQTRTMGDLSEQWVAKIKESIRSCAPKFSTRRMLREYMQEMYLPTMQKEK